MYYSLMHFTHWDDTNRIAALEPIEWLAQELLDVIVYYNIYKEGFPRLILQWGMQQDRMDTLTEV